LRAARPHDRAAGGASYGPHRADLAVAHAETGVPAARCSTGEQKSLLIAIVLGHAALLAEARGRPPILLLDEVAAHLDRRRRGALFAALRARGGQSWLSGTDEAVFAELGSAARFVRVEDGRLAPAPERTPR
jgi:DNA replication and repair protein RecF